jgi:hypothetical protein
MAAMSKKHSDHYIRQEKKLRELGILEYRRAASPSESDTWVDEFLKLESKGWKGGENGRAFAKREEDSSYFRQITAAGFFRNRVTLLSLVLNGNTIAMKHNILAGDGSFVLRIAYDETFAKYSPGVLLEFDDIRRLYEDHRCQWVDPCTEPRHRLYNRVWRERRMIRRTLFSNGTRSGDFWIAQISLLRWARKLFVPAHEMPAHLQISTRAQQRAASERPASGDQ